MDTMRSSSNCGELVSLLAQPTIADGQLSQPAQSGASNSSEPTGARIKPSLTVAKLTRRTRTQSDQSLDSSSSSQDHNQDGGSRLAGQKKQSKPRRRVATIAQRRAANIRERRRMFNLNSAFDRLRKKVPSFAYEKRLSRIETLKLAIMYIRFMDDLVNDDAYAEKYKQLTANASSSAFLVANCSPPHGLAAPYLASLYHQQQQQQHQIPQPIGPPSTSGPTGHPGRRSSACNKLEELPTTVDNYNNNILNKTRRVAPSSLGNHVQISDCSPSASSASLVCCSSPASTSTLATSCPSANSSTFNESPSSSPQVQTGVSHYYQPAHQNYSSNVYATNTFSGRRPEDHCTPYYGGDQAPRQQQQQLQQPMGQQHQPAYYGQRSMGQPNAHLNSANQYEQHPTVVGSYSLHSLEAR